MPRSDELNAAIEQAEYWGDVWWAAGQEQLKLRLPSKDNGLIKMAIASKEWAARFRGELAKLR